MKNRIGDVYGLWVITRGPFRINNVSLYECQCTKCKNYSLLKLSNIKRSRGRNCKNCTPDYKFTVSNGVAEGVLPDGTSFLIDEEDIPRVIQHRWFYNSNSGYIATSNPGTYMKLHRFILNLNSTDDVVVDHINRVKTDCRKANIRIASVAQNSLNKTLRRDSKTGYMGVGILTPKMYKASIQIAGNGIILGKSENKVICAQMYNIASSLLFGEFGGERNDVPEPTEELKQQITDVCMPYVDLAKSVTKSIEYRKEIVA